MSVTPTDNDPARSGIPHVSDHVDDNPGTQEPGFACLYPFSLPDKLADNQFFTNGHPWELYKTLREEAPIAWHTEPMHGTGFWSVVGYHDIKTVELDTETFSSQMGGINLNYGAPETRHPELYKAALNTMICLDQPWHMPLRREHMKFFTPNYVRTLQTRVEEKIDSLLDTLHAKGPLVDFVEYFSAQLPMFTLCEMLGIPEADRPKLIEWMHHLELAADTMTRRGLGGIDPTFLMTFLSEMTEMFAYGREILYERRENPRDDLLSAIANATVNDEQLSEEFLDGSWLLILFAGNDTTRNSLSGTIRLLTEFPDQKRLLVQSPDKIPNAVNEAIRMVTPVIYMRRTATKDTVIADQKIAAGEKVAVYYGGANRDPSIFENPDQFIVDRANAGEHLAFGFGPHVCLGKRVANMQLEAALSAILKRFPDIEWTGDIEIAPNNFVHAISKLMVNLGSHS